jgi:eukaryotic-like serine/threonine-protein kinase
MTLEQWARVKRAFLAALDVPAEMRDVFLAAECAGDLDVRREVECFLGAREGAGNFLGGAVFTARSTVGSGEQAAMGGPSLSAGARVGRYEIVDGLRGGGMGEVYRARDVQLGRLVAIKVLPRVMAGDPLRLARFEVEARASSSLSHPNIVAVHDTGWHEGLPFIVTELLEGEALDQVLERGPLPVREAVMCALQSASGLVAAHERGIVHRDLKPANLFLTARGQVKILDFGVAKLMHPGALPDTSAGTLMLATMPGMVLGTVGYMSPEQVLARPIDPRADQFSLGCVLYEMLTGRTPFQRPSATQTMAAVIEDDPPPLAEVDARIPRPVVEVVERCLAKDPDHRYACTRDLVHDLEQALCQQSEPCLQFAGASITAGTTAPQTLWRAGLMLMVGAMMLTGGVANELWTLRRVRG